jgi:hypothetical protein
VLDGGDAVGERLRPQLLHLAGRGSGAPLRRGGEVQVGPGRAGGFGAGSRGADAGGVLVFRAQPANQAGGFLGGALGVEGDEAGEDLGVAEVGLEAVEFAVLAWVNWFNNRRLLEPLGYLPPAEYEDAC